MSRFSVCARYVRARCVCVTSVVCLAALAFVGCGGDDGDDGVEDCLTSIPCVGNSDCDVGQHCNTALATPMCQVLYCGEDGTQCSESELCAGRLCDGGVCACEADCTGLVCGPDPVCGQSCGTCDTGFTCQDGACVEGSCVPACGTAECGMDAVCGTLSCGTCDDGYSCESGLCVQNTGWEPDDYTVSCSNGMCLVPAGPFWMGCNSAVDDDCWDGESPYHEVTLSGYYIDKTEVTVAAYGECVTAGSCTAPSTYYLECNWNVSGKEGHPVNCITWTQSEAYCTWAGKRLPTEAEWEKAARGTDGRKYPWGNEDATCDYAVMNDSSAGGDGCGTYSTWDVCSKSPAGDSPYGLCDMSGNVTEWVSDWYDEGYYSSSPASNPTGPDSGSYRVTRGDGYGGVGGFGLDDFLRASSRSAAVPSYDRVYPGFRCASPQ